MKLFKMVKLMFAVVLKLNVIFNKKSEGIYRISALILFTNEKWPLMDGGSGNNCTFS